MGEVPRTATPLSETDLALALSRGHVRAFGLPPSLLRLGVAWAQCALEHAHGKALWNFCVGNVTADAKWVAAGKDYYVLRVQERIHRDPDIWKTLDLRFRSCADAASGADGYWRLLAGRYAKALARFDAGDPSGAALILSTLNYYTAREEAYAAAMVSLYRYFVAQLAPAHAAALQVDALPVCAEPDCDGEMRSALSDVEIDRYMAVVAASLIDLGREAVDEADPLPGGEPPPAEPSA